jgi:putative ABC transport system permease protein
MAPPRLSETMLRMVCRGDANNDVIGDLAEEFAEMAAARGPRAARRWYRRQAWRSAAAVGLVGGREALRRLARAPSVLTRLLAIRADLGPAMRAIARAPWYATTAAAVIALSIGLATTAFAVLDGLLFKPLPYAAPQELVNVVPGWRAMPTAGFNYIRSVSWPDLRAWREAAPDISFGAAGIGDVAAISDTDSLRSAEVDRGYLDLLGVRPAIGAFATSDFGPTVPIAPGLLTDAAWRARFGADPGIVGRTFQDGKGAGLRITGVLPAGFVFPHNFAPVAPEVLVPLPDTPSPRDDDPRRRQFTVVARVPASARAATQARLESAVLRMAAAFPPVPDDPKMSPTRRITSGPFDHITLDALDDNLVRRSNALSSGVFTAAVALVLLGCLNLAGLAAGRALDRHRELALRRSLGARAVDIVRGLAVEQGIVIVAGAAGGVLLARWWLWAFGSLVPAEITFLKPPAIDVRVVVFAALAALAALTIVTAWGARPALVASARPALADAGGTTPRSASRLRRALVGAEVALAFVIALGGALFVSSFATLWSADHGLRVDDAAHVRVRLAPGQMPVIQALLGTIRRVPGVSAAGGIAGPFLDRAIAGSSFDRPEGSRRTGGDVEQIRITAGTIAALGLRPLDGRLPTDDELDRGVRIVVVSRTVADAFFPDRRAVGQPIVSDGRPFEIVGVVGDIRQRALDMTPGGEIYSPLAAEAVARLSNVVLAFAPGVGRNGLDKLAGVTAAIARDHPNVRVVKAVSMAEALGSTVQAREFQTWLFVSFAVAALAIAAVGILGLVAMSVSRRTREMGVRLALGATPGGIVRLMLFEYLPAAMAGVVVGGLAASWAAGLIARHLYQITAYDGRAWAAAAIALIAVSGVAALVPAHRAGRVDPVRVLRAD